MLLGLLRILSGVPILSLFMGGMLFLVFSVTLKGRSVGLSAALLAGLLYCSAGYWNRQWFKKRRRRLYAVLLPISLALFLIPLILAPNGQGAPDGHVRNCYVGGHGTYPRYSPWNVVPEVDQVMAGMNLLALGDPYVDFEKGKRIRSLAMPLYETLEKDVGFESLGSVMGMAYCELFRMEFRTGHYYLFLPTASERAPSACLIYLHGMGGNRKSHFWVLSRIALQQNCAVIAPTFGLGNWDKPGGAALVIDVAHDALATLPIDPERMFLLGYSNGAKGVTRAVMKEPDLFRGLIYLSPVTEDDFFSSPEFLSHHESRKILFLHGGQDRRIPRDLVESTASLLRQQGCDVRIKVYDDEDHYLILSQSDAVTDEIIEWMSAP
jgi:pimeloyl-ACP methyl ester carboxylesterase